MESVKGPGALKVEKTDHPDIAGGIVWTDCELRWLRAYGARCYKEGYVNGMEGGPCDDEIERWLREHGHP